MGRTGRNAVIDGEEQTPDQHADDEIHAEGVLRVPRVASRRMMLICGTRSIVLLRTMSPDRTSVATKPAIMPFNAFDITTSQISGCVSENSILNMVRTIMSRGLTCH